MKLSGFFVTSFRGIRKPFQSPALYQPPAVGHNVEKNLEKIADSIFLG